MDTPPLHRWDLSPAEARDLQEELRGRVIREDRCDEIHRVAGLDVSFDEEKRLARAAVAVLELPDLTVLEQTAAEGPITFPYIPGLFSFREIPPLLAALDKLQTRPDLLLCDGQGWAHPRRFGLACHLGVLLDLPSIGAAKTLLLGRHEPLPPERGSWMPLIDQDEIVGAAVRTQTGVRPVYVSVGHRVSLETAVELVLEMAPRYRLPEPSRRAHGGTLTPPTPPSRSSPTRTPAADRPGGRGRDGR